MFLFFVGPISYGWGYRKWGAPFPRYIQRRLGAKTGTGGDFATLSYQHWGWGGDLVWMVLLIGPSGLSQDSGGAEVMKVSLRQESLAKHRRW